MAAALQRVDQQASLADEFHQSQYPEDAQAAQQADDNQRLGPGDQQRQPARQDGDQVDGAVEALQIIERPLEAVEPEDQLDGKEDGEGPFDGPEQLAILHAQAIDALQHHHQHAGQDGGDQGDVEALGQPGIRLEDDLKDARLEAFGGRLVAVDHGRVLVVSGHSPAGIRLSPTGNGAIVGVARY